MELYSIAYPETWFRENMLDIGYYYGIRKKNRLVAVSGVHVFSEEYRVAALGNIATHPDFRGRGYGRQATAALCRELLKAVDHIGLNVAANNIPAIKCYERIGFEKMYYYFEVMGKK